MEKTARSCPAPGCDGGKGPLMDKNIQALVRHDVSKRDRKRESTPVNMGNVGFASFILTLFAFCGFCWFFCFVF